MPKKKHHHEEHEEHVNHEAWVIPYADMLTLLMGLFLVLWAISNQDLAKFKEFGQGFGEELGLIRPAEPTNADKGGDGLFEGGVAPVTTPPSPALTPEERAMRALQREEAAAAARELEAANLTEVETVISSAAASGGAAPSLTFRREARGLVVSIVSDDVLFEPGSATLRTGGLGSLDAVAKGLARLPNPISIEGHTDSRPISTSQYPSNWELSTARAAAVLRYLASVHGLDTGRMVAGGYADQRPAADNGSAAGRARNRRVDIAVLSTAPVAMDGAGEGEGDPDG